MASSDDEAEAVPQHVPVYGDGEDDCFDYVCAICDNGGDLYICEGKCMRSFHANPEDGDSECESLGLTDAEMEAIRNVSFYCENCQYNQHQCFACGELGSSDESCNPEVFCCVNGACGHFYHRHCVAELVHPGDSAAAELLQQKIAAGEPFECPAHRCHVCKEEEVKSIHDLQFAVSSLSSGIPSEMFAKGDYINECRHGKRNHNRKSLGTDTQPDIDILLGP